eukprot:1927025-Amphidinium_carterae.1
MAGILLRRSETNWPCYITLVAPIFVILSLMKFVGKFQWYSMPMERIIAEEQKSVKSRVLQ